jgi:hypothetical protein
LNKPTAACHWAAFFRQKKEKGLHNEQTIARSTNNRRSRKPTTSRGEEQKLTPDEH